MKNRRNANGKNSRDRKALYYEMEFLGQAPPTLPRRRRPLTRLLTSSLLGITLIGATIGVATIVVIRDIPLGDGQVGRTAQSDPFRWAVNRATSAAELTQQARSVEEWRTVATWWKEAIDLMREVPMSYTRYDIAQSRIPEYERNLKYAQRKIQESTQDPPGSGLWSVGSRRAEVIYIQGEPASTDRYDSICKEVLRYGKSTVELRNGMVVNYEDFDRNLRATRQMPEPAGSNAPHWGLGSSLSEVFTVQGTPSRVIKYDYSKKELLYYGDSTVEITDERVTGYSNLGGNLRVQILPMIPTAKQPYWTMDSTRDDVFRIQGTPSRVELDDASCTETLSYGKSSIELTNGFITGYDNIDLNLKVRAEESGSEGVKQ